VLYIPKAFASEAVTALTQIHGAVSQQASPTRTGMKLRPARC